MKTNDSTLTPRAMLAFILEHAKPSLRDRERYGETGAVKLDHLIAGSLVEQARAVLAISDDDQAKIATLTAELANVKDWLAGDCQAADLGDGKTELDAATLRARKQSVNAVLKGAAS